ncbi:MAG: hypothetical protein PHF20_08500 [Halothiobacillaceae bacterium]|nr:hypothetical protein [Halothiobacillaceae bacterium]
MRDEKGRFIQGASGNPYGRPSNAIPPPKSLEKRIQQGFEDLIHRLADVTYSLKALQTEVKTIKAKQTRAEAIQEAIQPFFAHRDANQPDIAFRIERKLDAIMTILSSEHGA